MKIECECQWTVPSHLKQQIIDKRFDNDNNDDHSNVFGYGWLDPNGIYLQCDYLLIAKWLQMNCPSIVANSSESISKERPILS